MLDTSAVERLVEQQIKEQVNEQVKTVLSAEDWLADFEQRIVEFVQSRVIAKFANAEALPEIVETVKTSVNELFRTGAIPGIEKYVDPESIKKTVDIAVEQLVESSIDLLGKDPQWLEKIERQINQSVVDRVVRLMANIDINPIIKGRIDENMQVFRQDILTNFASTGIDDQTTTRQLTLTDDDTVVENRLTSRDLNIANSATIQDLIVKGSVNIDNSSWDLLADGISEKTLTRLSDEWKSVLVDQVAEKIKSTGIEFDTVTVGGELLVDGSTLSKKITTTNIQQVGILKNLEVAGSSTFNNGTLNVLNKRLGVNTETPEMALSIWDEEVSVVVGKNKANEAYIGTARSQAVVIGVNRTPQIEITVDGLTRIKQLQVGVHKIAHAPIVPGWSGTKGDIVFNSDPKDDSVFAWVCLGAFRWKPLKSA
jgi:hypothetical protein